MPVFDGAAGESPAFAAFVKPEPASFRRAVSDHALCGCGMLVIGVVGLIALFAAGDDAEAIAQLPMTAFFAGFMWLTSYRRGLRSALAAPGTAKDTATIESGPRPRLVVGLAAFTLLNVAFWAFGSNPSAFIALGFAALELFTVARLRGWERRHERTLYSAPKTSELYAR